MVLFGRDFDKGKRLPWAPQILGKRKKPAVKIAVLHEEAIKRWKRSQILRLIQIPAVPQDARFFPTIRRIA